MERIMKKRIICEYLHESNIRKLDEIQEWQANILDLRLSGHKEFTVDGLIQIMQLMRADVMVVMNGLEEIKELHQEAISEQQ